MIAVEQREKLPTWRLRERFAAGLSAMYGSEVPAYTTLVEVSTQVNRDYAGGIRAHNGWARCPE